MGAPVLEPVSAPASVSLESVVRPNSHPVRTPRTPKPKATPLQKMMKTAMHWIRRGHLYFGLFLFPWAVLYGVTAFLFNHPTAFSDQPITHFGKSAYGGAPLLSQTPEEMAREVIAELNRRKSPEVPFELGNGRIRFSRENAFVTFRSGERDYNMLFDVYTGAGTVRAQPQRAAAAPERVERNAPFALGDPPPPQGGRGGRGGRGGGGPPRSPEGRDGLPEGRRGVGPREEGIPSPLKDRVAEAAPKVCSSLGLECSNLVVTSVPDLVFPVRVGSETWTATYSLTTGAVTGQPANATAANELSFRRFLLRLHTAHGYPSAGGVRWAWAAVVDVVAAIMCFWGVSGILMWWQIKATRKIGFVTLFAGLLAAALLGVGMHIAMTS